MDNEPFQVDTAKDRYQRCVNLLHRMESELLFLRDTEVGKITHELRMYIKELGEAIERAETEIRPHQPAAGQG